MSSRIYALLRFILLLALICFTTWVGNTQGLEYRLRHYYTPEACQQDLDFIKSKLEKEHPALYLYTPRNVIDHYFDSIRTILSVPTNDISFYNYLTSVLSLIRDGNTVVVPDPGSIEYNGRQMGIFPFDIYLDDKRVFVLNSNHPDERIKPGTELLLINGISVPFLSDLMLSRQARQGSNPTFSHYQLEKNFGRFYSYHIGNPDTLQLLVRYPDKSTDQFTIRSMTKDSMDYYNVFHKKEMKEDIELLNLEIDTTLSTAVLTVRDLNEKRLKENSGLSFSKTIPKYFQKIKEQKIKYLVLDLRDNPGGDLDNVVLLLSHLLDTSFRIVHDYSKVDPSVARIPEVRLESVVGPIQGLYGPADPVYTGKLYVLINGGTLSEAAAVSGKLKAHKKCIFMGEETGGNSVVTTTGGAFVELPNTKINVFIPALLYEIQPKETNSALGLQPDYYIRPDLEDKLTGQDPVLRFAYQYIAKEHN